MELWWKSEKLAEMNVSLTVLLEHLEGDLEKLENMTDVNIIELVLSYAEKLINSRRLRRRI